MIQVQLLDCDSIDQAKDKILKAIYRVSCVIVIALIRHP